ncbi:LPS export ABC transporter permease LptG [Lamprobacter modestohalophilus]|uniref:LPS export ABC transporter permease LptG n=1 Tax=Lamprobacter modestohalophilus TaxID=1064514 RepID=A0A9X0W838_9GAMM|nr:LPS export ABC transporter permease LptG [Lamprobacter modestohalophilus]MBK1618530.1 LPS export ABC transporter permease LptG [Lamprobacter modestohalophilus]MCF7995688.1 LPS export ABC transporter permease LptG [Chromatiaceae bacterium]
MRILDRYLAGAVIGGTLLTLAVLLPLLAVFVLTDEMGRVGSDGYELTDALLFVTLTMPRYLYQVFPIATLIGALIGLGQLAARSELVAMRAAGLSIARIVQGAMLGGLLLALLATSVGEVVAPAAEQRALAVRATATSGDAVKISGSGFWARDGNAFINVRQIEPGAKLSDIDIFVIEDHRLTSATHAREARYRDGHWVLSDIERSQIGLDRVDVERLDQARWDSLLNPRLLEVIVVEPHALPIWGLYRYLRYMQETEQDAGAHEVVFWSKVVQPLLILVMIFVAIPVLLGSARSTGTGIKLFIGIALGILFYLVSRTFTYLALLYGLNPALAAFVPLALLTFGAVMLLRRVG